MNKFDVIVVGTGMGGSTAGYTLAKSGLRVLFLEKGKSRFNSDFDFIKGHEAESYYYKNKKSQLDDVMRSSGRYSCVIKDNSAFFSKRFRPFIGSGDGGGSAIYGAILQRFSPEDFELTKLEPVDGGRPLESQTKWPVSYNEMRPYYKEAESLYKVHKYSKSSEPEALSEANKTVWDQLKKNGLNPYMLPVATENLDECYNNCQGFLCAKNCKHDSSKCALKPAIEGLGAQLFDECEVLELKSENKKVTHLLCNHKGKIISLSAETIVLAAGALVTPTLLLKSKNMANSSGLVGKNLMRHYIDVYQISLKAHKIPSFSQKQIGFNDFYNECGEKLGSVQSFGVHPPFEVILDELLSKTPLLLKGVVSFALRLMLPMLRGVYKNYIDNKLLIVSLLEDAPNINNCVTYKGGEINIKYRIFKKEKQRINKFRKKIKKAFSGLNVTLFKQVSENKRIAHACGTCRFGADPKSSVLDKNNKCHDLDNLYIVDSSFFPTSGGTNPSLTIAANAIRVGEFIAKKINIHDNYNKREAEI